MSEKPVIVWFRSDLRLSDNPALAAACATGKPILPLYILDDASPGPWKRGAASRWWLYHSLKSLSASLQKSGLHPLALRKGDAEKELHKLVAETGAEAVYWNRRYEPWAIARDTRIKKNLKANAESFGGYLMFEPWEIKNKSGEAYRVFTPFSRACMERADFIRPPMPVKIKKRSDKIIFNGLSLDQLGLLPKIKWYSGMESFWTPGEEGAQARLRQFTEEGVTGYQAGRDYPAKDRTSRLSPHLHFGEISPHQIWHAARGMPQSQPYLRQLLWREFSYHLLYHTPDMPEKPWNRKFSAFAWKKNAAFLDAWNKGETGYPIIDAGMRQLWQTGWMHNRVRMIAGSFLVKNLLQDWRRGEAWFWDTLVDADLANNAAGWQWIAGCGADAAPYFRVFNPVLQGKKFDPAGEYIRAYVPELKNTPDDFIHEPWKEKIKGYPQPIVDLSLSREKALEAYAESKSAS